MNNDNEIIRVIDILHNNNRKLEELRTNLLELGIDMDNTVIYSDMQSGLMDSVEKLIALTKYKKLLKLDAKAYDNIILYWFDEEDEDFETYFKDLGKDLDF